MAELRPIALLEKTYKCDGSEFTHFGLIFMGRVLKPDPEKIKQNEDIKGILVDISDNRETNRLA